VLALIEELLAELGEEGQEFAGIDREKLQADIRRNMAVGPDSGPDCGHGSGRFLAFLAKEESGAIIGVLTLSTSFALYAGGEYGVIDEMYVRPGYRCRGVGRQLVAAAAAIAREKRWFRLDVTGPEGQHGERAVRFYERLGFEFSGPKLRLLV
jgi:GNAT superfamily N-acetyltransferase